jgi:hypothetical protein
MTQKPVYALIYMAPSGYARGGDKLVKELYDTKEEAFDHWFYTGGYVLPTFEQQPS